MSLHESIAAMAQRAPRLIDELATEEATKNGLVMPFLAALGYDVFDPREVVPEFTADVGTKKGEKVDYAIKRDDQVIMLVECKAAKSNLNDANISQLYRYFSVTSARIGILTNGVQYRFFSDLDAPNKMDPRPFLEIDLLELRDSAVAELRKLSKEKFDLELMLSTANELKSLRELKQLLQEQLETPSDDLVRFFFGRVNPRGRFTATAKEQFSRLTRLAFRQFIAERVSDRLRTALEKESAPTGQSEEGVSTDEEDDGIETTVEEIEGYHLVKAIVREVVDPSRVTCRDTRSYMGVLLDDNNRKPICRLHFNRRQKHLGLFDEAKTERREPIESLNDIYKFSEELKATATRYDT